MELLDMFAKTESMRCFRRDTLPTFYIKTDADDLTGCTMNLILEKTSRPGLAVITKACAEYTFDDDVLGYSVQLTTTETANLLGLYRMHFVLTDSGSNEYRKLVGTLEVLDAPVSVG